MSRDIRPVSLSRADDDIKEYLDTIDDKFSSYVKKLIRQDMNRKTQDSEVKELIKTINKLLDSGNISINREVSATTDEPPVSKKQVSAISSILNKNK